MKGKFFGVGVGPGDPELITVKAINVLKNCDCVVVPKAEGRDSTVFKIAKEYIKSDCEICEVAFSMVKDSEKRKQSREEAAKIIAEILDKDKKVAFITLGDISVYSTCMYVYKILFEKGYECELIAGVPSFCAVASKVGESLGEDVESFGIVPSALGTDKLSKAVKDFDTVVIMKSAKKIEYVKEILKEEGFNNIKGVMNCGLENERIFMNYDEIEGDLGYFTTLIAKRGE